jgi:hypothetical protein
MGNGQEIERAEVCRVMGTCEEFLLRAGFCVCNGNRTGMRKNDVACPFSNEDILTSGYIFSPVLGFRKSTPLLLNRRS